MDEETIQNSPSFWVSFTRTQSRAKRWLQRNPKEREEPIGEGTQNGSYHKLTVDDSEDGRSNRSFSKSKVFYIVCLLVVVAPAYVWLFRNTVVLKNEHDHWSRRVDAEARFQSEHNDSLAQLKGDIKGLNGSVDLIAKNISKMENKYASEKQLQLQNNISIAKLKGDVGNLTKGVDKNKINYKNMEDKLTNMNKQTDQSLSEVKGSIEKNGADLKALSEKQDAFLSKATEIEQNGVMYVGKFDKVLKEINETNGNVQLNREKLTELESKQANHSSKLAALQRDSEIALGRIEKLKSDGTTMKTDISSNSKKIDEQKTSWDQEKSDMDKRIGNLSKQFEGLPKANEQFNKSMEKKIEELKKEADNLENIEAKLEPLKSEKQILENIDDINKKLVSYNKTMNLIQNFGFNNVKPSLVVMVMAMVLSNMYKLVPHV